MCKGKPPNDVPVQEEPIPRTEEANIDMTGEICLECKSGVYNETYQMDDIDGVLHCTACGHQVNRWSHPN